MLDLNVPTLLLEIFNFLLLSALLYRFLFRPVMRRVEARAAEKRRLMRELDQEREAAAHLRADRQAQLAQVDEAAAQVLARAREQIEAERQAALRDLHEEAERTLHHAQAEARQAQQRELDAFRAELLDAMLDVSGQLIGQAAPEAVHDALVEQVNDRVWELGRSGDMQQVESLRRSLGEREPIVRAVSARQLSPEQHARLARTFSALADRSVKLEVECDGALALGLRVRIGDLVVDNSIAGRLSDLRDEAGRTLEERLA